MILINPLYPYFSLKKIFISFMVENVFSKRQRNFFKLPAKSEWSEIHGNIPQWFLTILIPIRKEFKCISDENFICQLAICNCFLCLSFWEENSNEVNWVRTNFKNIYSDNEQIFVEFDVWKWTKNLWSKIMMKLSFANRQWIPVLKF